MKIREAVKSREVNDQILHLRARNNQLSAGIARLQKDLGKQKELAVAISAAVHAAEPFPRVPWKRPARSGSPVVAVLKLSDWHIGERISRAETEGFGSYNWRIAQARLFQILGSFLKWVHTQRAGYRIDQCAIFGEGDYISGDIHRELSVTNEFPIPVQTANAGQLFGEAMAMLAAHFGHVTAYEVGADNHGRLQPKPQFKQKVQNSMSYLVHVVANSYVRKIRNIEPVVAPGIKYLADVAGWKFLIEHGDTVKAWMGIPYYGMERERGREASRRMNGPKGFDYQSTAHWHVPGLVAGNVINGSLSGTSEFDHGCGRHAPPSQVAFLVHPKHGIFNFVPFIVR